MMDPRNPSFYKGPHPPSKGKQSWKQLFGKIWDGTTIWVVLGTFVRDNYDVDFVMGGHGLVYAKYIPKDEIWLEDMARSEDDALDLAHEIVEYILIKYGPLKNYDKAHEATAVIEGLCRKTLKVLKKPPKLGGA